jgi:hypothetical protein
LLLEVDYLYLDISEELMNLSGEGREGKEERGYK